MKRLILLVIVLFGPAIMLVAQEQTELEQTGNKLARDMADRMPGWQHRRGNLIKGSSGVVVEIWTLPNRIVKVSMMKRDSVDDAREKLAKFAQEEGGLHELKGFGDEAYAWGDDGANIVFRRGKYTIYITTIADVDRDSDSSALSPQERHARKASEMKRLSKQVAKEAVDALDLATKN
jgi:hypothetical protein